MSRRELLARMGNGSVRRVRDQYEVERNKRQTGDKDMFMFQDSGFDSEKDESHWDSFLPRPDQVDFSS